MQKKKKKMTCWTVVPASHESHLFCVCTWFERHSRDCVKPKESPLELQKYKLSSHWQKGSKMQPRKHVFDEAQNCNSSAAIPYVTQDFLIWYYTMRTETLAGITSQYFELEILQMSIRQVLHSSLLQNGIITHSPVCSWHEKKKMPGKYFWNRINSIAWFLPLLILMREHGKVWIKYLFHTHSQTQPNISWKCESKNKSIIINTPVRRTILPVRLTFSQSLCLLYDWVQIAIIFPREQLNTATNVKHKHNSNYKQRSDDQLRFKGSLHMNIHKYHWQP